MEKSELQNQKQELALRQTTTTLWIQDGLSGRHNDEKSEQTLLLTDIPQSKRPPDWRQLIDSEVTVPMRGNSILMSLQNESLDSSCYESQLSDTIDQKKDEETYITLSSNSTEVDPNDDERLGMTCMQKFRFFMKQSCKEVCRHKCHFCLSFCSVFIIVLSILIGVSITQLGPIIFLRFGEHQIGEYDAVIPITSKGLMMNVGEVQGSVAFLGYRRFPDGAKGPR